jgi:hypothetical protein
LSLVARGERPGPAPPKTLNRPDVGGTHRRGAFVEVDRTLETRSELVYQGIEVLEPFDGKSNSTIRPGGHLEDEVLFFVSRGEYSVLSVEAQLAWLPVARGGRGVGPGPGRRDGLSSLDGVGDDRHRLPLTGWGRPHTLT